MDSSGSDLPDTNLPDTNLPDTKDGQSEGLSRKRVAGSDQPWLRMTGLGIELASYTLGLAAIGYFIDARRGHVQLYATGMGAMVGFAYGMFRFIQKARIDQSEENNR